MAERELLTQARNALIVMVRRFTGTPSTLRESEARVQAHAAIRALDDALAAGVGVDDHQTFCDHTPRHE